MEVVKSILMTIVYIVFWLVVFYGTAAAVVALPEKLQSRIFDRKKFFYRVRNWEMRFYRFIRLPFWKDKLPQHNSDFDKRRLPEKITREYLVTYIFITCRAEVIHYITGVVGYFSLLFCLMSENLAELRDFYFAVATAQLIGNIPFSMIQRYNRYRLERVLTRYEN